MSKVRVNAGTDSVTGKRIKVEQTGLSFDNEGQPTHVTFLVKFYEADNNTEVPVTGNALQRRAVSSYEDRYNFNGYIDPVTKLIVSPNEQGQYPVGSVEVKRYFETKALNSFPQVAGADSLFKLQEGILKEVVAILQANGLMPS